VCKCVCVCVLLGTCVTQQMGKARPPFIRHHAACCKLPIFVNCSGCYTSCGLQICGVAPETFSLSMRSCPSSSQLIVNTNLSHVSSGNHCRSDPVQVQSTFGLAGTSGSTAHKINIEVVLSIDLSLGTTLCVRSMCNGPLQWGIAGWVCVTAFSCS
jgi:hypothetical protein